MTTGSSAATTVVLSPGRSYETPNFVVRDDPRDESCIVVSRFATLKLHVKPPLPLVECQETDDKLRRNAMHIQVFREELMAYFITDSSHVRELMERLPTVFMNHFTNIFFSYFLAICQ